MQLLQRDIRMKPVRVLVADDDAVFRSLVCSNLDGHADSVSEAEDGQRAWELLVGETFELAGPRRTEWVRSGLLSGRRAA